MTNAVKNIIVLFVIPVVQDHCFSLRRRCCRAAVHGAFDQNFLSRQARFTAAERYLRRKL
jgi:hypothetical protein